MTGCTFGSSCINTNTAMATTMASIPMVMRLVREPPTKKANATLTSVMSNNALPRGVSTGPWAPRAWNMAYPRRVTALSVATIKQGSIVL